MDTGLCPALTFFALGCLRRKIRGLWRARCPAGSSHSLKSGLKKKSYMELRLSYEKRGEFPREREWERENPERMIGRVGWLVGSVFS